MQLKVHAEEPHLTVQVTCDVVVEQEDDGT